MVEIMLRLKLKSFIADERGAYTIEYSLVLLMSATAAITGYTKAGNMLNALFVRIAASLS